MQGGQLDYLTSVREANAPPSPPAPPGPAPGLVLGAAVGQFFVNATHGPLDDGDVGRNGTGVGARGWGWGVWGAVVGSGRAGGASAVLAACGALGG
jgi:hypothetical protein